VATAKGTHALGVWAVPREMPPAFGRAHVPSEGPTLPPAGLAAAGTVARADSGVARHSRSAYPAMNARESALVHLRGWTVGAERLPAGATLLEPVDSSEAWWAIRHPRTGALFGWHADPHRLVRLYWQALDEEQRLELVAEAVATIKNADHRLMWQCAWSNWATGFGARVRAAERVAAAWRRRNKQDLEHALAGLAAVLRPDPAQDPQAPAHGEPADGEDFSLRLATAALVQGDDRLARLIYSYSLLARRDRSRLSALLDAAAAAVDRLPEGPGEASPD
jgi:hypothetical protein